MSMLTKWYRDSVKKELRREIDEHVDRLSGIIQVAIMNSKLAKKYHIPADEIKDFADEITNEVRDFVDKVL